MAFVSIIAKEVRPKGFDKGPRAFRRVSGKCPVNEAHIGGFRGGKLFPGPNQLFAFASQFFSSANNVLRRPEQAQCR